MGSEGQIGPGVFVVERRRRRVHVLLRVDGSGFMVWVEGFDLSAKLSKVFRGVVPHVAEALFQGSCQGFEVWGWGFKV